MKSVRFFAGSTSIGNETKAPFSVKWRAVSAGTYALTAVATDNSGAETTSAVVMVMVKKNVLPSVRMTAPSAGASFIEPDALEVSADASDSDGWIKSVRFLDGTKTIGTVSKRPFSVKWHKPSVGDHALSAVATDNRGGEGFADAIRIQVKANVPPAVSITSPSASDSFTDPAKIVVTADASDSDGSIRVVRFYADDRLIGGSHVAPYRATMNHVAAGTYTLKAVATDDHGDRTSSAPVQITVKPNVAPTVSITSPANNSTVQPAKFIDIKADAGDSGGGSVRFVKFYVGGMLIGVDFNAPYHAKWWRPAEGSYDLRAVAFDNGGLTGTSAIVHVTVSKDTGPAANTPTGDNVVFTSGAASVTFAQVTTAGDTTVASIAPPDPSQIPTGFSVDGAVAFDLSTTAAFSGGATVCLSVPSFAGDAAAFSALQILHGEGGAFVDRTILAPAAPAPDFGSKTICASVTSLSPFVIVHTVTTTPPDEPPPTPDKAPLVQPQNLVYQGAFRVPSGVFEGANLTPWEIENSLAQFSYGGTSLAYNPANDSLFIVGHDQGQLVAEVDIPTLLPGAAVDNLNTGSLRQAFTDPTDQLLAKVNDDPLNPADVTTKIGGMLPYQNQLYLSAYIYYDGRGTQHLSHFVSGLDLSVNGDARGPYEVQIPTCDPSQPSTCLGAGFFSGYFALVPLEWQAALGGPVLNGNCCLGVISRTSFGPAVSTIDPAKLGAETPLQAKPLVYYPTPHPLLEPGREPCLDFDTCHPIVDGWSDNSTLFNGSTEIRGVVFPDKTRSVLFFGRHGVNFCYGPGTDDPALVGTPATVDDDGNVVDSWCLDPEDSSKGVHGYPYLYYVWAYDANDLAAVASGQKLPWEVRPYAVWPLSLPFSTIGSTRIGGAAFDPQTRRLFISQLYADDVQPVIHVFTIPLQ